MSKRLPQEDSTPTDEVQEAFRADEGDEVRRTVAFRNELSDEEKKEFDATHYVEEIHGDYETWLDEYSHYRKQLVTDPDGRRWIEWTAPGLSQGGR